MSVVQVLPEPKHRACWLGELLVTVNGMRNGDEPWEPYGVSVVLQFIHDPQADYSRLHSGNWQMAHIGNEPYVLELGRSRSNALTPDDITDSVDDLAALIDDAQLAREISDAALALLDDWDAAEGSVRACLRFNDMAAFNESILGLAAKAATHSSTTLDRAEQQDNLLSYWQNGALVQFQWFREKRGKLSDDELPVIEQEIEDFRRLREAGIDAAQKLSVS